jgi:GT2 family glycosyltransferase
LKAEPIITTKRIEAASDSVKLSIIIVNYRSWTRLRMCLSSLQQLSTAPFGWEVIVVDNHSNDDQLTRFINDFPEFNFYESPGNHGFASGCNAGVARSTGTHLLFLNPDTTTTVETLDDLLCHAIVFPEFTVLSCDQVTDNGKDTKPYGLSLGARTLTSFFRSIYRMTHTGFPTKRLPTGYNAMFPDWISGSVVLIERDNFDKLGGWDDDFWMYFEDADLCRKVWGSGGKVALIQGLSVVHNHGGASRQNLHTKALTKSEVIISRHVYIQKHTRGVKRFAMHAYLIVNNLLFSHLLAALAGVLLFFIRSLRAYPMLYGRIASYYCTALINGTWLSVRSVHYKKRRVTKFAPINLEA